MSDHGNSGSIKMELVRGLAKGGPAAMLLGMVLYWLMNIANAKLDTVIAKLDMLISLSDGNYSSSGLQLSSTDDGK